MKSGANYVLPAACDIDDISSVQKVIFTFTGAEEIQKVYPGDGIYFTDKHFMIPMHQEDTMALAGKTGHKVLAEAQANFTNKSVRKTYTSDFYVNSTMATEMVEDDNPSYYELDEIKFSFLDGVVIAKVNVEEVDQIVEELREVEQTANSVIAETRAAGESAEAKGNYAENQGNEAQIKGINAEAKGNYAERQGDEAKAKAEEVESFLAEARPEVAMAIAHAENVNATVSKSGKVATFTVTDHNGNQNTVQILDGERGQDGPIGPQGPSGADGKDYVITEADYQTIADKVEAEYTVELGGLKEDIAKVSESIVEISDDLHDLAICTMQYVDSTESENNTLWRNLPTGLTRASGFNGYTTFSPFAVKKGTYYISKNIWHKYSWAKNSNGVITAINVIDGTSGDKYKGAITFSEDVEIYITIQTAELPLMIVDGDTEPTEYRDKGAYEKSINGEYKVVNYTLSDIEKSSIKDFTKIDYHFVKDGKLVCNNSMRTSSGAVAKYTRADMVTPVKKAMCKFTTRGGGNVTLIACSLDTDNHVQNIVNKSIHCIFGLSSSVAQTFLNGVATSKGTITYSGLVSDDSNEYECGFEILNNGQLRLYAPNGDTLDCDGDWSDFNGRFFIFEEYNGAPSVTQKVTFEWERPSILSVYCKPTTGHCLRDDFKNYNDGHIPIVSPSGHTYTNFRNIDPSDDKYVNANGTHDNN